MTTEISVMYGSEKVNHCTRASVMTFIYANKNISLSEGLSTIVWLLILPIRRLVFFQEEMLWSLF